MKTPFYVLIILSVANLLASCRDTKTSHPPASTTGGLSGSFLESPIPDWTIQPLAESDHIPEDRVIFEFARLQYSLIAQLNDPELHSSYCQDLIESATRTAMQDETTIIHTDMDLLRCRHTSSSDSSGQKTKRLEEQLQMRSEISCADAKPDEVLARDQRRHDLDAIAYTCAGGFTIRSKSRTQIVDEVTTSTGEVYLAPQTIEKQMQEPNGAPCHVIKRGRDHYSFARPCEKLMNRISGIKNQPQRLTLLALLENAHWIHQDDRAWYESGTAAVTFNDWQGSIEFSVTPGNFPHYQLTNGDSRVDYSLNNPL